MFDLTMLKIHLPINKRDEITRKLFDLNICLRETENNVFQVVNYNIGIILHLVDYLKSLNFKLIKEDDELDLIIQEY